MEARALLLERPKARFWLGLLAAQLLIGGIALWTRTELLMLAGVAAVAIAGAWTLLPSLWIGSLVLSTVALNLLQSEEVTAVEIVVVAALIGTLLAWLGWHTLVQRRRLILHWGDLLLLLFLGFALLNLPIALLNDVPLLEWMRGWVPLLLLLAYFPVRHFIRRPKQVRIFLGLLLLCGIVIAAVALWRYRQGVSLAEYAYQLRTGIARSHGEHLLAFLILGCIAGMLFLRHWRWRLLLAAGAVFMGAAVIVTFSRTAWLSLAIGVVVLWLALRWKQRLQLLFAGIALPAAAMLVLTVGFPQVSDILLRLVQHRFASIAQGRQDLAVGGRIHQLSIGVRKTLELPLGGHGIRKPYSYLEPAFRRHISYAYIHNAYVATAYRQGIPMLLLLVAMLGAHLFDTLRRLRRTAPNSLERMTTAVGIAALCAAMLSLMMTENPLDGRTLTITLAWTLSVANLRLSA